MIRAFSVAAALLFLSCGAPIPAPDAGPTDDAGISEDAGTIQDAGTIEDAGTPDAGPPTLTSTVLTDAGTFPTRYTCGDTTTTGRVSPPLAWTAIPDARSYALVMTDTSIDLIHWIIWNIPASTLALPEGVSNLAMPPAPAGALQTTSYDQSTYGYRGPCPPAVHTYRFVLTGLDVATLPGVSTSSSRAQVAAAINAHVLEAAALSANYGP